MSAQAVYDRVPLGSLVHYSLISPTIAPPRKPGLPRIAIPTPCLTKSRHEARDTIEGRAA